MNKLNIFSMFPQDNNNNNNININNNNKNKLNIHTFFEKTNTNMKIKQLDSNKLIETKIIKRKKVLEKHIEVLNSCYNSIETANNSGITDLIFNVPHVFLGCSYYDQVMCSEFVLKKLHEKSLDAYILDNFEIFITWQYIELNKEQKSRMHKNISK